MDERLFRAPGLETPDSGYCSGQSRHRIGEGHEPNQKGLFADGLLHRGRVSQVPWYRAKNTYEPIISKDVFEQVQEQIANRRRSQKNSMPQIFAGLVRCADRGWSMIYATNNSNKKPFSYYKCGSYRQLGRNGSCSSHYIRYDVFYTYVLSRIQHWAKKAELNAEELLPRQRTRPAAPPRLRSANRKWIGSLRRCMRTGLQSALRITTSTCS